MPKIDALPSLAQGSIDAAVDVLPIVDVSANQTDKVTVGALVGAALAASPVTAAQGGTGQASYTDGQLLIGNTATGGLSKATLTAGSNITITNGNGTISIASTAGGSGTVTSVSVATANGFAGSVANPTTTPAITLTTPLSGLLKGNGTAMVAASSGTDFSAGTSGLGTGIVKTTTGTGALTVAVAADFPTLNQNTTGTAAGLSAVLAVASGGTNSTATPTAGGIGYGTGTAHAYTAAKTTGTVWLSGGAGVPTTTTGTLALAGNFATVGAFATTFTMTGVTGVTFPTSGTLLSTAAAVTVAQGGTGLATLTSGSLIIGAGTSTPTFLAPGSNGNVATVAGGVWTSAAPSGGSSALTVVTATAAAAALLNTNLSSTYNVYDLVVTGVTSVNNAEVRMRMEIGGSVITTSTYQFFQLSAVSIIAQAGSGAPGAYVSLLNCGNGASNSFSLTFRIYSPSSTALTKMVTWTGTAIRTEISQWTGNATNQGTGALTGIQIYPDSGTITCVMRLYGVPN